MSIDSGGYDQVGVEHVAVMEGLLAGHQSGDRDAVSLAMQPDVVVVQPASLPFGGTYHGVDGVELMMARLARHWARRWNWVERHPCRGFVLNHEEVVWSAATTGREVTIETVSLYRFRDGRIARIDVFIQDTALLLSTLAPVP